MGFLSVLLCSASMLGAQFAPKDVPKDHWAYSAVNELFQNGLLDGYPGDQSLKIDPKLARDFGVLRRDKDRWKTLGLLVGYPEGLTKGAPEPRWEFAVMVHATWANLREQAKEGPLPESSLMEIPKIADAISMLAPELERLGADTHEMIAGLNRIWPKNTPIFRG